MRKGNSTGSSGPVARAAGSTVLLVVILLGLAACDAVQDIVGGGPNVIRIVLTPDETEVPETESITLAAVAYGDDGVPVDARLTWISTRPQIASVNASGVVTGHWTHGDAVITARTRSGVTSNEVTVRVLPPRGFGYIRATPSQLLMRVGDTANLTATVYTADDEVMELPVVWQFSEETDAISIDATGKVTAHAPGGPFRVYAAAGGQSVPVEVTVSEACIPWSGGALPRLATSSHQLLQVVDVTDNGLPLTTGRPSLFRLLAAFDTDAQLGIRSRLTVEASLNGRSLGTLTGNEVDCLPEQADMGSLATTYNVLLPVLSEAGQLELHAELELLGASGEVLMTLRHPETGTITREVFEPPLFGITFVPIAEQHLVPDIIAGDEPDLMAATVRWFPIRHVDADIRAPVVYDGVFQEGPDGMLEAMTLVSEVALAESSDPARHYHGLLHEDVAPGGGMGSLVSPYAVTVLSMSRLEATGEQRTNSRVVAHELGHNFGLRHAPCGSVATWNEDYPYPDGVIGAYGFDHEQHRLVPPDTADFLGYCWPWWISDYHYGRIIDFRNVQAALQVAAVSPGVEQVLLVSGSHDERPGRDEVRLRPAFTLQAVPQPPRNGGWTLVLVDAYGHVLQEVGFEPERLSEEGLYRFGFTVAVPDEVVHRLAALRVIDSAGQARASQTADPGGLSALAQAAEVAAERVPGGVRVTWNSDRLQAVLVRDADSGTVLGRGTSGWIQLPFTGTRIQVLGTDGVNTHAEVFTVH